MATLRLDKRRVDTLKPHKSAYDVRDRELKGFGVRILPSGAKRYFIHSQHHGRRVWKIVGQAGSFGVDEARDQARVMLASIRNGTDKQAVAPQDTVFEIVGDEVFRRYARNWKPSTLKVNRNYYRNHILPWFEGRPIGDIAAHDVRRWFASLHNTPVSADRSAPSCRSSCARPRSTATGRREPIRARASGDTGARGGSASCRSRKSDD